MSVEESPILSARIENLPAFPAIVPTLLKISKSPGCTAEQVAEVLSRDQAIAAGVLRLANSPYYCARRRISELSRAVVRLGNVAVRNLVLAICARQAFSDFSASDSEYEVMSRHSLAVAAASQLLASEVRYWPDEEALVAGLLHDIGRLAMFRFDPDSFRALQEDARQGLDLCQREKHYFGVDHAELGFRILDRWGIPYSICQAARRHQAYCSEQLATPLICIVVLADGLARLAGYGFKMPTPSWEEAKTAAEHLGLEDEVHLRVLDQMETRLELLAGLFSTSAGPVESKASRPRRVFRVSKPGLLCERFGDLLLRHLGFDVRTADPSEIRPDIGLGDWIFVDGYGPESDELGSLLTELPDTGQRRIAVLTEPSGNGSDRSCDPVTGLCQIPRAFDAGDLRWLEEVQP